MNQEVNMTKPTKTKWEEQDNKLCSQVDDIFNTHLLNENKIARDIFLKLLLQSRLDTIEEIRGEVEKLKHIYDGDLSEWTTNAYNHAISDVLKLLKK